MSKKNIKAKAAKPAMAKTTAVAKVAAPKTKRERKYAVIRFDPSPVAKANTVETQKKIDSDVRCAFAHIETAKAEAADAEREFHNCPEKDVERKAALQARKESLALFVTEQIEEFDRYLEEQMAMFSSRQMNPERAYREAIVPTGEVLANGVAVCRIVPRGITLEPVEEDALDGHTKGIAARMAKTITERVGIDRGKGKYNDGAALSLADSASIELGEVQANGGGFYDC